MAEVLSFREHPLVEGEPGEFPIDETCRGVEVDRLCPDRICSGPHFRSPVACLPRILPRGNRPVPSPRTSLAQRRLRWSPSLIVHGPGEFGDFLIAAW